MQRELAQRCGPRSSSAPGPGPVARPGPGKGDPGSREAPGGGPLHTCARRGDGWACAVLVTLGADVSVADGRGATPLMLAALGGHEAVRVLVYPEARP